MLTRRSFLGSADGVRQWVRHLEPRAFTAGGSAWSGPIGLELYTVRELFAKDPAGTLKQVAAAGYKEVGVVPSVKPASLNPDLRAAGLTAPSGYFDVPKDRGLETNH